MKVFVTGATGFVGTAVVNELLRKGHKVVGMTRSDEGAESLKKLGVDVVRGSTHDLDVAAAAAAKADGVIHLAFNHDMSRYDVSCQEDSKFIDALTKSLENTHKPLIVTSGTAVAKGKNGGPVTEDDAAIDSKEMSRSATEEAMQAAVKKGVNAAAIRLPQVHDTKRQGLVTYVIGIARQKGYMAVVGDGSFRWPAVHISDVATLYASALEKNEPGAIYHAVAEEGVSMKEIIDTVGNKLSLEVKTITPEEAQDYYAMLAFAMQDIPASSTKTQSVLNWKPTGPTILEDLRNLET